MMWALRNSCANATLALREGMRESQRTEWRDRSGRDDAFPRKVQRRRGMSAPQARLRHPRHCSMATSRYLSGNTSGCLPFVGNSTRRVARKAAIPSLHWKMNGKIGHSRRCPSWYTGQTTAFAMHLLITPIFAATRSTGGLFEGSPRRAKIAC